MPVRAGSPPGPPPDYPTTTSPSTVVVVSVRATPTGSNVVRAWVAIARQLTPSTVAPIGVTRPPAPVTNPDLIGETLTHLVQFLGVQTCDGVQFRHSSLLARSGACSGHSATSRPRQDCVSPRVDHSDHPVQ